MDINLLSQGMSGQIKRQVTFGMGFILITNFTLKLPLLPTVFLSEDLIVFSNDSREEANISTRRQSEQSPELCFLNVICSFKVKATYIQYVMVYCRQRVSNSSSTGNAELTLTRLELSDTWAQALALSLEGSKLNYELESCFG